MPYIDVRFHFETEEEHGYTHYSVVSAQRLGSDIPSEYMQGIGETLGQSDHWNVGSVGATLDAMTNDDGEPKTLRDYW